MFKRINVDSALRARIASIVLLAFGGAVMPAHAGCLIVKSGTCYVLEEDMAVECVTVETDGCLIIPAAYVLTLQGGVSTIDGSLYIAGKLDGHGTVGGNGLVQNDGYVSCNDIQMVLAFGGLLTIQDSACSDPRWCVFADEATLQFDVAMPGLEGDFAVANGQLEVNADIETAGRLLVGTEGLIDLNAEMCVTVWKFGYAPGQSGCGGTVDTLNANGTLRYDTFTNGRSSNCTNCADPGGAAANQCRNRVFDDNALTFTCGI